MDRAFGVGFYSVFSDCEEPFVSSGKAAMAFYWKGNQLFTKVLRLPEEQASNDTTFVLEYRNTTSAVPSLLPLCQFLASSLTFVGLSSVELWIDQWRLFSLDKLSPSAQRVSIPRSLETKTSEGLMKVDSIEHQTLQLSAKWLKIVGWDKSGVAGSMSGPAASSKQGTSHGLRSFFSKLAAPASNEAAERRAREERVAQQAILEDLMGESSTTIFLNVSTAAIVTNISKAFGQELERATKKPAPKSTKLAVLTTSHNTVHALQGSDSAGVRKTNIFATVLPSKSGRVFIGFPTHQTTGLAAHISAPSVIPTVERESIDLNARWVRTWNMEMLRAAGIVCRVAWMNDMTMINDDLKNMLSRESRPKLRKEDIDKVLPAAAHLLNQFTFNESTPSSSVGTLVEEAFWTCNKSVTIEILSNRGVLPSEKVRIATDELSFVDGIPIVPSELFEKARPFVSKLVDFGIVTEVTTADIKQELERQAIDEKQFAEFLGWLGRKARAQEVDSSVASSLLSVAVVSEGDNESGKVLVVGQFKHFLNPSRIPGSMPVPPNTVPFRFTKSIDSKELEAIGWSDLQVVPWVKFLMETSDEKSDTPPHPRLTSSLQFAAQVLPVISKQWEGLSQSSKQTITNLLIERTVIPTKQGLRRPADSYFPTVKLFDDLPVITVPALREKFLTTLGVRKTIQLNLVFERLLKKDEKSLLNPAWSHVELIKYLSAVRADIPKEDIKNLRSTPISPAEKDPSSQQYRLCDLFEPKPELRALGLNLIQWPAPYRLQSEEAKFMRSLGLREYPDVQELITLIASATRDSNFQLRDRGLKYLVDYHNPNKYSSLEIGESDVSFLPIQGNEHETSTPSSCYTDTQAAIMGFPILRADLHPHDVKLGVRVDPPIEDCALWLVKNPPQSSRLARQLFEYFATRLRHLSGQPLSMLSAAKIVPVVARHGPGSEEKQRLKMLAPNNCFLGSGGRYAEIFDYVDFGQSANAFLMQCGAKSEPSVVELGTIVAREPARIFNMFETYDKYLDILASLARDWSTLKKNKTLVQEMKKSPFLLASREMPPNKEVRRRQSLAIEADYEDEEETIQMWQLAPAGHITLVDDPINYRLFKSELLSAPMNSDIETFYGALGASTLSSQVDERPRLGPTMSDQSSAIRLRQLVIERIKLFYHYHDVQKEQIKRPAGWIDKNVEFIAVSSISIHKSLKSRHASLIEKTTAISDRNSRLWFTPGSRDLYNVSHALLQILLNRSLPNQALVLTSLLEMELGKLQRRGYDVSRILRRKEAEARIAEEERRKQLEEEQKRMLEARAQYEQQRAAGAGQHTSMMPGVFPESPNGGMMDGETNKAGQSGGVLSSFSGSESGNGRNLGGAPQLPPLAPAAASSGPSGEAHTPHKPVTSPEHLRRNLLQAIKTARPHDSKQIVSKEQVNEVQETRTFCDARRAQNIGFFGAAAGGTKVFFDNAMPDKPRFWLANVPAFDAFEAVLRLIADAMQIPPHALHIFFDESSDTIAFNSNRSLFCNYRYFYQLHLADVQQGRAADAVVYWFVTLCHELAHNLSSDHGSAHSYYTESFVAQFFAPVAHAIAARAAQEVGGESDPFVTAPPRYTR